MSTKQREQPDWSPCTFNMTKYLVRSPVKGTQAQDLGSENDAVSVDDAGYEYLPVEAEDGQGQDVVLDARYDHDGDGERPLQQLRGLVEQVRVGASIHSDTGVSKVCANKCELRGFFYHLHA